VKAIDELCTRTFAVHTLIKSPPTKMHIFPDGGQTLPTGGSSPPKAPILRGAAPGAEPGRQTHFELKNQGI